MVSGAKGWRWPHDPHRSGLAARSAVAAEHDRAPLANSRAHPRCVRLALLYPEPDKPGAAKREKRKKLPVLVERPGADLHRGGYDCGRGVAGAAGLIVDRERRKLRRNYAKLSQPKPMKAGAAPALQLLDLL